jgi:hypothetical protein
MPPRKRKPRKSLLLKGNGAFLDLPLDVLLEARLSAVPGDHKSSHACRYSRYCILSTFYIYPGPIRRSVHFFSTVAAPSPYGARPLSCLKTPRPSAHLIRTRCSGRACCSKKCAMYVSLVYHVPTYPECHERSAVRRWSMTTRSIPFGGSLARDTAMNAARASTHFLALLACLDSIPVGSWRSCRKNLRVLPAESLRVPAPLDGQMFFLASMVFEFIAFVASLTYMDQGHYLAKDIDLFMQKYSASSSKDDLIQERRNRTKVLTDVGHRFFHLIVILFNLAPSMRGFAGIGCTMS